MPQQFEWSHNSCWSLWGDKLYLCSLKADVPVVPTWSWKCGRFLRPSWSLVHEAGLENMVSAIYKGASSSTANQLRCKKEPKPAMDQMFLLDRTCFYLGCYQRVPPTIRVGLPTSVKVIRALCWVILLCHKLTLKPRHLLFCRNQLRRASFELKRISFPTAQRPASN